MPSHHEYALMCNLAYKLGEETKQESLINRELSTYGLTGWRVLQTSRNVVIGTDVDYFAIALQKGNEVVIAHRGTVMSAQNIVADLQIITGQTPMPLLSACMKFVGHVSSRTHHTVSMTGHSLGGFLAAFSSAWLSVRAVTFDGLGAKTILGSLGISDNAINITNYVSSPNFVNTITAHAGERRRIFIDNDLFQPLTNFLLNNFIDTLRNVALLQELKEINSSQAQAKVKEALAWIIVFDLINTFGFSHSLENFIKAFNPITGNPRQYGRINHWPTPGSWAITREETYQLVVEDDKEVTSHSNQLQNRR